MLESILNSDPAPSLPNHEQSVPSFTNELNACEAKTIKSFVDEPPEVELKDLPPHLKYAFLEGDNKLSVIIAKELGDKEKATLIKVLKSHKRAIAWKLPWVSPVHCVPKKGGFTVVKNGENELIPTHLVTGWRENSPRIHINAGYEHERLGNVVVARKTVGSAMVQKSGIQCYNYKEYGHVARECQKPKRAKDSAYHGENMLLSHYMYMAKIQKVSPDAVDSRPIFDTEPEQKIDQNDEDADLAKERELLASLIEKLKCEIDETKNHNTLLETSNKVLVEKLKIEIDDFKNKNKSLTEANNKLSKKNDLLYADFKKSKA
nr:hypothetical protein [Tanacetum cinerariifolium]